MIRFHFSFIVNIHAQTATVTTSLNLYADSGTKKVDFLPLG